MRLENKKTKPRRRLLSVNDIEIFLDHLHVAHLAAAFESTAKARLGSVIGETRKSIRAARKSKSSWPENLVRTPDSFGGLRDIIDMISTDSQLERDFNAIRICRNELDHGSPTEGIPPVSSDEALSILKNVLALIS